MDTDVPGSHDEHIKMQPFERKRMAFTSWSSVLKGKTVSVVMDVAGENVDFTRIFVTRHKLRGGEVLEGHVLIYLCIQVGDRTASRRSSVVSRPTPKKKDGAVQL